MHRILLLLVITLFFGGAAFAEVTPAEEPAVPVTVEAEAVAQDIPPAVEPAGVSEEISEPAPLEEPSLEHSAPLAGVSAALPPSPVNYLIHVNIPPRMDICGEPVPLDREDVAERLEYELLIMLGNPVQTSLWLKRFPRFMPEVELELLQKGLPEDLKYVAVIESSLRADAVSGAGAVGPWQFIVSTGKMFGLDRASWGDERRDWRKSTSAALKFLNDLHGELGSWALALAAYNCGPGRVRTAMESQRMDNFYGLVLPEETERYVFRFLAAKAILKYPELYGIDLKGANLFDDRGVAGYVFENRKKRVSLLSLAEAAGISYRYFLEINPQLNGADLPRGTYTINLPKDSMERFASIVDEDDKREVIITEAPGEIPSFKVLPEDRARQAAADNSARAKAQDREDSTGYKVAKGDTLSSIARKFKTTVAKLQQENSMGKSTHIKPGQMLVVP